MKYGRANKICVTTRPKRAISPLEESWSFADAGHPRNEFTTTTTCEASSSLILSVITLQGLFTIAPDNLPDFLQYEHFATFLGQVQLSQIPFL
jgi:hypothetical protein